MSAGTIAPPPDRFAVRTDLGVVALRPADPESDLDLVHGWMNRPHVAEFWHQDWPADRIARYLAGQHAGRVSRPCVGLLAGIAVSYWEVYRPAADPLGEAYQAEPTDLGVHIAIGNPRLTGRGLGSTLLAAVAGGLLATDPSCHRVVAEPDVRNTASIRAFTRAGFRRRADIRLPDKDAALMVYSRENTDD